MSHVWPRIKLFMNGKATYGKNNKKPHLLCWNMLLKSKEDRRTNICSHIEKPIHSENHWFSLLKKKYHKKKQIRKIEILTCMFQCPELKVTQDRKANERTCSCFQKSPESSSYFGLGWSFLSSKMFLQKALKPHYGAKRNGKELHIWNHCLFHYETLKWIDIEILGAIYRGKKWKSTFFFIF